MIDPAHRGSGRDRDLLGPEGELADVELGLRSWGGRLGQIAVAQQNAAVVGAPAAKPTEGPNATQVANAINALR